MNQGSIETRSSSVSVVEQFGVRAPVADFSQRSQSSNDRFDSIFDSLQQRTGNEAQTSGYDREYCSCSTDNTLSKETETSVQQQNSSDDVEEHQEDDNVGPTSAAESPNCSKQEVKEDDSDAQQTASESGDTEAVATEKTSGKSDEKKDASAAVVTDKPVAKSGKQASANRGENRAVKLTEEGKVSSSKSFQLQTQKVTVVKDADAEKSAKTTVLKNGGETPKKFEVTEKAVTEPKQSLKVAAVTAEPKAKTDAGLTDQGAKGLLKAAKAVVKGAKPATPESKVSMDPSSDSEAAVKKSTHRSAKTSTTVTDPSRVAEAATLKNPLKTAGLQAENRLAQFDQEIGIKTAEQAVNKQSKMVSEVKNSESAGSEKGFLKEANPNGSVNRAQAVTSRSDTGGFFSNSSFGGQQGQSDANSSGRGSEHFRQWVESNSEVRSVASAAQQGEFVDRAVGSALSARVVNQIMSHIDRLRDSEKNRVKVSLGSEANGVTVDIRIEGDAIYTSFEGDPQILNQLKDEWDDIKNRASRKGVSLNEPEFIEISYSSSSESESFLPDDGIAKEEKSQSVIQHKNNQPVRPGEMTAAAGSSGPVHSFYA